MHRFCFDPAQKTGNQVLLDEEESKHLLKVLRLELGAPVIAFDGAGHEYTAVVQAVANRMVQLGDLTPTGEMREAPVAVTLIQGVAKGEKMDWIVQKATELGVARIVPVWTERTVVRLDAARSAERAERWQKIAREATKQSRRTVVPTIDRPCAWAEALARWPSSQPLLVPWEDCRGTGLGRLLRSWSPAPAALALAIGPEGGLTAAEVAQAEALGARAVTLGPRILRTETAALAGLAAIMMELGDWR
ncbi:16S rRNA (uracil(1498)-N(3))-methyltransferase [Heliophilum fasciatum]|uniref:Ribosomal RNA small subunit methyltransferase E n=1 Tax=Heliophilum fasciatum TaxID=35700 RepID=A0A4R2RM26_9FIRM|nr:16S rRNA (uracil(1498)-N(3))-methyltransferase [Heliophilum fasciatum]MCW2278133.1 16S rRNA (uracil1498-N3)-methyltransferase [Heliophilum fasciatum]TCP64203.1 16S rRNA (uracil1498-N3)-methyltransferase [Heliophilum fasciatum]